MAKIVTTNEKLISDLKNLASRKTRYVNRYPYNLCYNHSDGYTSADCSNLYKSLFNGYDVNNRTVGYYQRDLSNTGDITEAGLIAKCTDIKTTFDDLKDNEFRILYMRGHIGGRVPTTIINGKTYNVIEATPAFGGGIIYTYVDEKGNRYNHKGGTKKGVWLQSGKPTLWVSYNATEGSNSSDKPKVDYSTYPVLKKGSTGKYVTILQQLLVDKGYDPKGIDGDFGKNTLKAVTNYQKDFPKNTDINGKKLVVDGCVGQKTWGSLYK